MSFEEEHGLGDKKGRKASSKAKSMAKKVNAGKGHKLSKSESAYKTRDWPTGKVDAKHERRLMGRDS